MQQLSFFSAGFTAPVVGDLGGLLAAHGQITASGGDRQQARLSVLVGQQWRASALVAEFEARGIAASVDVAGDVANVGNAGQSGDRSLLVAGERSALLRELAAAWTRGAVKHVPALGIPAAGLMRCWALAAGRRDDVGYLLGVDARSPQTHTDLAAVLSAAGIAGSLLGPRAGGPALRIVGRRRLERLADLVGDPPPGAPDDAFPLDR